MNSKKTRKPQFIAHVHVCFHVLKMLVATVGGIGGWFPLC